MKDDPAIEALLDLDGSVLDQGNGYSIHIAVQRIEPSFESHMDFAIR